MSTAPDIGNHAELAHRIGMAMLNGEVISALARVAEFVCHVQRRRVCSSTPG